MELIELDLRKDFFSSSLGDRRWVMNSERF